MTIRGFFVEKPNYSTGPAPEQRDWEGFLGAQINFSLIFGREDQTKGLYPELPSFRTQVSLGGHVYCLAESNGGDLASYPQIQE